MATPEDYDQGTSSDASSWESSFIGEYTIPEYNTGPASPKKYSEPPGRARSNTFASSPAKGPGDTGRARSKTKAGGEDMVGEFSDMVYQYRDYYSSNIYGDTQASTSTAPAKGSKDFGGTRSNTTGGHDADKAYQIPAYSDSSSKTRPTTAESDNGGKEGGQKEVIKPAKLVQTQINLGQNPITTCSVCKFTHNRTVVLDVKAHDRFHQAFVKLAEKLDMDEF